MDGWSEVNLDLCMDACFDGWIDGGMMDEWLKVYHIDGLMEV